LWATFSAAELLDSSISGDLADPNRNGIPNLIEYALGGDPTGNATGQGILPQAALNSSGKLQVSFDRYVTRNDVTLTVEGSDALNGPWDVLARSTSGAPFIAEFPGVTASEMGEGGVKRTTIIDAYNKSDPEHPRRFVRLRAGRP